MISGRGAGSVGRPNASMDPVELHSDICDSRDGRLGVAAGFLKNLNMDKWLQQKTSMKKSPFLDR
jgi:hypothetical protein